MEEVYYTREEIEKEGIAFFEDEIPEEFKDGDGWDPAWDNMPFEELPEEVKKNFVDPEEHQNVEKAADRSVERNAKYLENA